MDAKEPEIPEFLLEQLVDEVSQKETLSSSASDTVKDSNILNLWVKLTLPVAAVLAIAFFINQGDSPTTQNLLNPAADSVEIASLEVEFGRWKDQVVKASIPMTGCRIPLVNPISRTRQKEMIGPNQVPTRFVYGLMRTRRRS